jgi:hypothetical protein
MLSRRRASLHKKHQRIHEKPQQIHLDYQKQIANFAKPNTKKTARTKKSRCSLRNSHTKKVCRRVADWNGNVHDIVGREEGAAQIGPARPGEIGR